MYVRVILRNHISQIIMYGKLLQLFSQQTEWTYCEEEVCKELSRQAEWKKRHRSSSKDDVSIGMHVHQGDSSDLKYDQG